MRKVLPGMAGVKDEPEIKTLPFVCGLTLQLAAGYDIKGNPQFMKTDTLVVIAAVVMENFLEAGHGGTVLEALNSKKKLNASDVADLHYEHNEDELRDLSKMMAKCM